MSMNVGNNDNDNEDIVAEMNMTPMIDIMLVLLIIFMVTSTVALESGLDVELPKASSTSEAKTPKMVVISLDRSGQIAVQGKKVTAENLQDRITASLKELEADSVIFEGDTQSQLGKAVEIMDIAKVAGAKNFSIAAENITKIK